MADLKTLRAQMQVVRAQLSTIDQGLDSDRYKAVQNVVEAGVAAIAAQGAFDTRGDVADEEGAKLANAAREAGNAFSLLLDESGITVSTSDADSTLDKTVSAVTTEPEAEPEAETPDFVAVQGDGTTAAVTTEPEAEPEAETPDFVAVQGDGATAAATTESEAEPEAYTGPVLTAVPQVNTPATQQTTGSGPATAETEMPTPDSTADAPTGQSQPIPNPADAALATGGATAPAAGGSTTAPPANDTYTIKKGDTLGKIAQQLRTQGVDVTWKQLQSHNNISNPRSIQPGQVLQIPGAAAPAAGAAATASATAPAASQAPVAGAKPAEVPSADQEAKKPTKHTVKKGDTLGRIAKKNDTTVAAIMEANPSIRDANKIGIGDKIRIPGTVAVEAEAKPVKKLPREETARMAEAAKGNDKPSADGNRWAIISLQSNDPNINTAERRKQVEQIQAKLNELGIKGANGKPLAVDGIYGKNSDHAVRAAADKFGLKPGFSTPKEFLEQLIAAAADLQMTANAGGDSETGSQGGGDKKSPATAKTDFKTASSDNPPPPKNPETGFEEDVEADNTKDADKPDAEGSKYDEWQAEVHKSMNQPGSNR